VTAVCGGLPASSSEDSCVRETVHYRARFLNARRTRTQGFLFLDHADGLTSKEMKDKEMICLAQRNLS
jgi:hypothetical protein